MKAQILKVLRKQEDIVSGETLSEELGISRVSVWKHIRKLQECGYDIESSPKGYRLINSPDVPYPWEFPEREESIHYFETVASTMTVASELARKGSPHMTVIIAGRQVSGRGRRERIWISPEGGLYFTMLLRPEVPPSRISRYNFCASLSLALTLQTMYQLPARVKWPNDVLIEGRKVAGILCEMEAETERVSYLNIGIGINVNNDPDSEDFKAASIKGLVGKAVVRKHLLNQFLVSFQNRISDSLCMEQIISEWKQQTITIGQHVKVKTFREEFEGLALDVDDEDGSLMLKKQDGSIQKVFYGDCFHQS